MFHKLVLKPENYTNFKACLFFVLIVFGPNFKLLFSSNNKCNDSSEKVAWIFKYIAIFYDLVSHKFIKL